MKLGALIFSTLLIAGCATVFKGYQSEIEIQNPPESLRVFTAEGVELPSPYKTNYERVRVSNTSVEYVGHADSTLRVMLVRSNRDYVFTFKVGAQEYRYPAYAKLNRWWFALDLILGGFPLIVDGITGNWNYYDPIEFNK